MMKTLTTLLIGSLLFTGSINMGGYSIGDKAIDFNLKNVDGKMVSMEANPENKGYLVIFTCNTCPYSIAYEDRIIELHNRYASKGFPVIAINPNDPTAQPDDSFEKMQQKAKEKEFPFPYLFDTNQEITLAYGATNTPHVYVVEKEGSDYFVRYIGAIDNNSRDASAATKKYVEAAVDALLTGKEVSTTSTKAIGCTIKWSAANKNKRQEG